MSPKENQHSTGSLAVSLVKEMSRNIVIQPGGLHCLSHANAGMSNTELSCVYYYGRVQGQQAETAEIQSSELNTRFSQADRRPTQPPAHRSPFSEQLQDCLSGITVLT
jgi:hypothetical protein